MKTVHRLLKLALVTSALACALAQPASRPAARQSDMRGAGIIFIKGEDGREVKLYERSYALVIGVGDYPPGWPKLPGVKQDVEEVARALERHGFLVTKVENPDSAQLDKSFKDFISAHGRGVENRLLFYFAGHGQTVKQSYGEEMGYIVPADAPNPARDLNGFLDKALNMRQVERYAEDIQAKHALFLFDSCFSGALFALSRAVPDSIGYKTSRHVRQFITSGSADERVPDQSIFRRQFVEALDGEADLNKDGYVTGTELGEFLQDKVINYSKNRQHPQYGKIRNPNLDKGDFVFALPKAHAPGATSNTATTPNSATPNTGGGGPPPNSKTLTNRIGMELVYVPPGSFMMGSEGGREAPVHRVSIREGFWMGKYEVTQAQWRAVMRNNPSEFKGCDTCPVERVSWDDVQLFVQKLNALGGGFSYRLPSEAEWEYACRAGTTGDLAGDLDSMAWHSGNAGGKTHPVGQKQPNGFGLYDMHGNVSEWVQDYRRPGYDKAPTDGSAWLSEEGSQQQRVMRGGGWRFDRYYLRSAYRGGDVPTSSSSHTGVRLVAVERK